MIGYTRLAGILVCLFAVVPVCRGETYNMLEVSVIKAYSSRSRRPVIQKYLVSEESLEKLLKNVGIRAVNFDKDIRIKTPFIDFLVSTVDESGRRNNIYVELFTPQESFKFKENLHFLLKDMLERRVGTVSEGLHDEDDFIIAFTAEYLIYLYYAGITG